MSDFSRLLLRWHKRHGRHDLPWQKTRDPYRVWLSEIMLQQTQVSTVIPYYQRFLARFPALEHLAAAESAEVMGLWSGLGYYARARNLHLCARTLGGEFKGEFPRDPERIASLPGIGRSTANAIAAFCFAARVPILDGNVKRVLARAFGIEGFPGSAAVEKKMWVQAEDLLPARDTATYIQAQMDLGATICTRTQPNCVACPVREICVALRDARVKELPTPRPKRPLPKKSVTLLVLMHQGRVLLQLRPPSGIWGGLLSLPESADDASATRDARLHLGCKVDAWQALPPLTHRFTHFQLDISPLLGHAEPSPRAAESGAIWLALDDLEQAALPTPIRRILNAVRKEAGSATN